MDRLSSLCTARVFTVCANLARGRVGVDVEFSRMRAANARDRKREYFLGATEQRLAEDGSRRTSFYCCGAQGSALEGAGLGVGGGSTRSSAALPAPSSRRALRRPPADPLALVRAREAFLGRRDHRLIAFPKWEWSVGSACAVRRDVFRLIARSA